MRLPPTVSLIFLYFEAAKKNLYQQNKSKWIEQNKTDSKNDFNSLYHDLQLFYEYNIFDHLMTPLFHKDYCFLC